MSKAKRAPLAQGILSNNNYDPINYQTRNITPPPRPPPNVSKNNEDNEIIPRGEMPSAVSLTQSENSLDEVDESTVQKAPSQSSINKKKKKYVEVPSRYKLTTPKSVTTSKEDEKFQSFGIDMSAILPSNMSGESKKPSRVTSTPYLMTSSFQNEPIIKQPMVKRTKMKKGKIIKKDSKSDLLSRDTTVNEEGNPTEREQLMVDLYNARLCQMAYLKIKAHQTLEKQEEKAKHHLYALWALNHKMRNENDAIRLSLETRKIEIKVDQLLKYQLKGLEPLQEQIPKLCNKLGRIEETLANSSHMLPTNNISITSEDNLVKSLDESKRLLSEINGLIRKEHPQIEELATASEALMETIKSELSEHQRCSALLKSSNKLLNHDRSLQVHLIELREDNEI